MQPLSPEPSFPCPSKAHAPLLLISGPNKDGFTPVLIHSLIQWKQYWEYLSMAGSALCLPLQARTQPLSPAQEFKRMGIAFWGRRKAEESC